MAWKDSPVYWRWRGMMARCNPNTTHKKNQRNYAERGIQVCDRWQHFPFFEEDMGPTFAPHLELDREDNSKGYSPDNCRWATRKQQRRNQRTNHRVTIGGKTKTIAEWSEQTGLNKNTILQRLHMRWPKEHLLDVPARGRKQWKSYKKVG
jgi:hypothetical protein